MKSDVVFKPHRLSFGFVVILSINTGSFCDQPQFVFIIMRLSAKCKKMIWKRFKGIRM